MKRGSAHGGRLGCRLLASPWLVGLASAFFVAMHVLHDVARVLSRSADVARRLEAVRAEHIADAAALAAFQPDSPAPPAGVAVRRDAGEVEVRVQLANGTPHVFDACELPGAAPRVFAHALAAVEPGANCGDAECIAPADLPEFDCAALAAATRGETTSVLRADPGLALLRWQAGTDADDFVFVDTGRGVDLDGVAPVLIVPGNLWIEAGARPLAVQLHRDLAIVVRGNLYLERSLRVLGPGRLVLVTAPGDRGVPFVDADGNGRWSEGERVLACGPFHGPIEGVGNVYVGQPGSRQDVECGAGLVVGGQLHLRGGTRCSGPVVLAHGLTALDPAARFVAAGEWRFTVERERVPGFATTGEPRPSLLRQRDAATQGARVPRDQTLYVAAPAR
jgi:hypothetical protein